MVVNPRHSAVRQFWAAPREWPFCFLRQNSTANPKDGRAIPFGQGSKRKLKAGVRELRGELDGSRI